MRWSTLIALPCLAIAIPFSSAHGGDQAIPQDPARQERAFRDRLEGHRLTLGGAYEKVGRKDPRWDKPAREALEAAALLAGRAADPGAGPEDVLASARQAVAAGCDDPMILFLLADSSRPTDVPDAGELGRLRVAAAIAMERSGYPALRKAQALAGAGMDRARKTPPTPEDRKEATRFLEAALALMPRDALKDGSRAEVEGDWFDLIKGLIAGFRVVGLDQEAASRKVDTTLATASSLKAFRLQIKAAALIDEAWEARGRGMADTVTEKGARTFAACLGEAERTLRQAWIADPKAYRTPTLMLRIMTGLGGERAEMETWFRRAMELKDDNVAACIEKMNYLDPKWHGSRDELMAFHQACRATKNWRGGLTLVSADAYMRWYLQLGGNEADGYLHSREVWDDIRSIYDEYLSHYPKDHAARSAYAGFGFYCGHPEVAEKEFNALGDRLVGTKFFSLEDAKQSQAFYALKARAEKAEADRKAAEAARRKNPGAPR